MSLREPVVPTTMGAVVLGVWIPLAWPVKIKAHFNQRMEGSVLGIQLQHQMLKKGHPDQLISLALVQRCWEGLLLFWLLVILPTKWANRVHFGSILWCRQDLNFFFYCNKPVFQTETDKLVKARKHYSHAEYSLDYHCLPQGKVV